MTFFFNTKAYKFKYTCSGSSLKHYKRKRYRLYSLWLDTSVENVKMAFATKTKFAIVAIFVILQINLLFIEQIEAKACGHRKPHSCKPKPCPCKREPCPCEEEEEVVVVKE